MIASRLRGAFFFSIALGAVACESPSGPPAQPPAAGLTVVSGNGQVGLVNQTLAVPLVVKVISSSGSAVKGVGVVFSVTTGSATVSPASTATDSTGQAKTSVTLGASPGTVNISATVSGTSLVTTFAVSAGALNATPACQTSSAQTPALGAVIASIQGTGICLGGATTGAEYALVAFHGDPDSSKVATLLVGGKGATAVSTTNLVPNALSSLSPAPTLTAMPAMPAQNAMQQTFEATRRETSRRELTPLLGAARAWKRSGAAFNTIPGNPAVGTLVNLNANGRDPCNAAKVRTGRVAAVSNLAIIVADTANPPGGFTDAEYSGFAQVFDTDVSPLDLATFGQPSDIDGNGKTIIFFTKEVNALTPKTSNGDYVGGFFFERDLFPINDNATLGLKGCAGSNVAEMFYMLVPDPNGVYSIKQDKDAVASVTPGTLAHEYQHLMNAALRIYTNDAPSFEDTWLNEGLSHIAEELLYYQVSGFTPRQNLGPQIGSAQSSDLFQYQYDNIQRFEAFIASPSTTSVYGGDDSLSTRGATWNLLRYLADHRGSSDGTTWKELVNTTSTGQANLSRVFGANILTQIRDWATSVFADDVVGVTTSTVLAPSWNLRNLIPRVTDQNGRPIFPAYPLKVLPLSDASPVITSVVAGGAAYLRFSVPAGGQASIDWSGGALPITPLMQMTIVRTK